MALEHDGRRAEATVVVADETVEAGESQP